MARFKLFPRNWRPSLGELLGISQAKRQVSQKRRLRIVRERSGLFKNVERRTTRRVWYDRATARLARFLRNSFS